jgi:hypothetical protein
VQRSWCDVIGLPEQQVDKKSCGLASSFAIVTYLYKIGSDAHGGGRG